MYRPYLNFLSFSGPLFLALMIPVIGFGLPEDKDQPIELEADRAQYDQKTGISIYEGNVIVTQGSMRLKSDVMTVYTKDGTVQTIEATGKPATFRYLPQVGDEEVNGVGQQVDYDAIKGLIIVTKSARFTQGQDVFTGERVEYDINTDVVKAGSDDGSRVKFIIQPKTTGLSPQN
jgi:lipopolysaccharide export system protein LptA